MKKQIVNVSIRQSSKFVAALYFVISFPIVLIVMAMALAKGQGIGVVFFSLLFPLLYAATAFIGTALAAWLYNLVAKRVGGIEFTTSEIAEQA